MPPRRDHDNLSSTDVEKILAVATATAEDHLFLLLLARTGRRIGEILEMTASDIDFEGRCIWTNIEKRRDHQRRKMFVDNDTLSKLNGFVASHALVGNDKIFPRCRRSYQLLPMRYAAKVCPGKYFTCHSFRHHFITYLVSNGWSYEDIARLTGHKCLSSLHPYDYAEIEVVEDRFRAVMRH